MQELQPNTTGLTNRTGHHGTALFYNPKQLKQAWTYLLNASLANPSLLDIPPFHNDIVDITRQIFSNAFITLYNDLLSSWHAGNITDLESRGIKLIDLLTDLDSVLATDETFILGKWIADARRWAAGNESLGDYLEYNARNQV
jgi:alpha-N-acetylglucosaminidase